MTSFSERVYALCSQIPKGKVSTYKAIAEKLGTKSYRAVGQALRGKNFSLQVPCHRVVKSNGHLGGFRGWKKGGKVVEKQRMLEEEGVLINGKKMIDLKHYEFSFDRITDLMFSRGEPKNKQLVELFSPQRRIDPRLEKRKKLYN